MNGKRSKGVLGYENSHVDEETLEKVYVMAWNAVLENRQQLAGKWTVQVQGEDLLEVYRAEKFMEYTDGVESITEIECKGENE